MRKDGKIVFWNEEKAFGFIEPSAGGDQVFAHITSFKTRDSAPRVGRKVSFQLAKDKDGRLCAVKVLYAGEKPAPDRAKPRKSATLWMIPIYFILLFLSVVISDFPIIVLLWQIAISVAAYVIYAWDKSSAKNNRWRTSESTLHMLALAGGWPGALYAQQVLRHKSKKESFRIGFWVTVLLSVAIVIWLRTSEGRDLLKPISNYLSAYLGKYSFGLE